MTDTQGFAGLRAALAESRDLRLNMIAEAVEDLLRSLESDERREIVLRVIRHVWGVQVDLPEVKR